MASEGLRRGKRATRSRSRAIAADSRVVTGCFNLLMDQCPLVVDERDKQSREQPQTSDRGGGDASLKDEARRKVGEGGESREKEERWREEEEEEKRSGQRAGLYSRERSRNGNAERRVLALTCCNTSRRDFLSTNSDSATAILLLSMLVENGEIRLRSFPWESLGNGRSVSDYEIPQRAVQIQHILL